MLKKQGASVYKMSVSYPALISANEYEKKGKTRLINIHFKLTGFWPEMVRIQSDYEG